MSRMNDRKFKAQALGKRVDRDGGSKEKCISRGRVQASACCNHQRGSLEHTLFGPFPRLVLVCINADFCDQGRIFRIFQDLHFFSFAPFQISVIFQAFAPFFAKFAEFLWMFKGDSRFCKFSSNFNRFSRNFAEFQHFAKKKCQVAMFQRNLRKFAEISQNIAAKLLKVCQKKCML